jgi:glycolate oxidase FAD binding subunit
MLVGSRGSLGLLLDLSLRVLPIAEESLYLVFEKEDLAASVAFAHDLIVAAEPLTGASFYQGRLHLRFSGRQPSMDRLRRELGGEADNALWWSALQQWQMPWAESGAESGAKAAWRSYRSHLSAQPRTAGQWLADWNGGLLWSEEEEPTAEASLQLVNMTPGSRSAGAGQMEDVQRRLRRAFDPEGVFVSGEDR